MRPEWKSAGQKLWGEAQCPGSLQPLPEPWIEPRSPGSPTIRLCSPPRARIKLRSPGSQSTSSGARCHLSLPPCSWDAGRAGGCLCLRLHLVPLGSKSPLHPSPCHFLELLGGDKVWRQRVQDKQVGAGQTSSPASPAPCLTPSHPALGPWRPGWLGTPVWLEAHVRATAPLQPGVSPWHPGPCPLPGLGPWHPGCTVSGVRPHLLRIPDPLPPDPRSSWHPRYGPACSPAPPSQAAYVHQSRRPQPWTDKRLERALSYGPSARLRGSLSARGHAPTTPRLPEAMACAGGQRLALRSPS